MVSNNMIKTIHTIIICSMLSALYSICVCRAEEPATLNDLPSLSKDTVFFSGENLFGYRGRLGCFVISPSRVGAYFDQGVYYKGQAAETFDSQSIKIMYKKADKKSFCGAYVIFMADLSGYKTMTFMVKGQKGGNRLR